MGFTGGSSNTTMNVVLQLIKVFSGIGKFLHFQKYMDEKNDCHLLK